MRSRPLFMQGKRRINSCLDLTKIVKTHHDLAPLNVYALLSQPQGTTKSIKPIFFCINFRPRHNLASLTQLFIFFGRCSKRLLCDRRLCRCIFLLLSCPVSGCPAILSKYRDTICTAMLCYTERAGGQLSTKHMSLSNVNQINIIRPNLNCVSPRMDRMIRSGTIKTSANRTTTKLPTKQNSQQNT